MEIPDPLLNNPLAFDLISDPLCEDSDPLFLLEMGERTPMSLKMGRPPLVETYRDHFVVEMKLVDLQSED